MYEAKIKGLLPNAKDSKDSAWPIARGSLLGFLLGILPGPGPVIASFVSYAMEKRLSLYPEKFGTGVIEGVAGPEAANNAATAGSFLPLLSLGIPTSAIMALFMGALMIHGIQPGPLFSAKYPELFWGFIASMYVGNAMLLVLNLPLIGMWVRVLKTLECLNARNNDAVESPGLKPAQAGAQIPHQNNRHLSFRDVIDAQPFPQKNVGQ